LKKRLNFRILRELCLEFAPVHLYQSVLNYTFPERVSHKTKSYKAYPFRTSEFVVDIDSYLAYAPHGHRTRNNEPCEGCIQNAYDLTLIVLEEVEENYSDIRLVFSGRQGFHIHVFDFMVEDWTHCDPKRRVKSHEVARFKYTSYLASLVPDAFDESHFTLSVDPMRVMSVPESLNGVTGVSCSYLGDNNQFKRLSVDEILRKAKGAKALINGLHWSTAGSLEFRPIGSQFDSNRVRG
jgi:hypothetical protein